jgi:hypothetical protein
MTKFFFTIGQFIQWVLEAWVAAKWVVPIIIIAVLLFGMGFWLWTQTKLSARAKERDEFI